MNRRVTPRRVLATLTALVFVLAPGSAEAQVPGPGSRIGELREESRRTQASIDAARAELDAAVSAYEDARTRMAEAGRRLRLAREHLEVVDAAYAHERERTRRRAVALYKGERLKVLDSLLASGSLDGFVRRLTYLANVADRDLRWVKDLELRRSDAEAARQLVRAEAAVVHAELRVVSGRSEEIFTRMRVLSTVLQRTNEQLKVELSKWRFPVLPPYSYTDSFGAPRMVGTSFEHSHEGQDIFAPMGTPVISVVSGVVENVGEATLGGTKLWLRGDDGFRYYYAHLSGYAPAGHEGNRVEAGTELGYVGDSGNAKGTPPHLHFEMHGPQGVINPIQTLRDAESGWLR